MRRFLIIFSSLLLLLALGAGPALPWTLDLYETVDNTPNGTPSEIGPIVALPSHVVPGFIYLLEGPNPQPNINFLSDILWFRVDPNDPVLWATTVQLWSDPSFPPAAFDNGQFWGEPSFYTTENQFGPTVLYPGDVTTYVVHSDPWGSEVPVPPTVLLLGSGFLGLAGWRRFKKN